MREHQQNRASPVKTIGWELTRQHIAWLGGDVLCALGLGTVPNSQGKGVLGAEPGLLSAQVAICSTVSAGDSRVPGTSASNKQVFYWCSRVYITYNKTACCTGCKV
jgi:hypothetical protein